MPKGIRKGKSPEIIKTDINSLTLWKHYKDKNFGRNWSSKFAIDKTTYTKFLKIFFEEIVEKMIYDNYEFKIPYRLGVLCIRKYQTKVIIEDGKVINNYPIDWNETIKLWEKDEEAKEKKILVKNLNKHSNGYVCKFTYIKRTANYKNKYAWWFRPTRQNKIKLKNAISKGNVDYYE